MAEVELARRAVKDLDALAPKIAARVLDALARLADDPTGAGMDVKALAGRKPWRRLRVGGFRVLYRLADQDQIVLIARVIDRKDLDRAVNSLPE